MSDSSTTPEAGVSEDPSDGAETPTFATTLDQSDYGRVGTKTITEAPPDTETMSATGTTDGQTATIPESEFGDIGSKTVSEKRPGSTTLVETVTRVTLGVTTITDADGSPIATSTRTLSLATSLRTSTLTNSEGRATATQVVVMTVTPVDVGGDRQPGKPDGDRRDVPGRRAGAHRGVQHLRRALLHGHVSAHGRGHYPCHRRAHPRHQRQGFPAVARAHPRTGRLGPRLALSPDRWLAVPGHGLALARGRAGRRLSRELAVAVFGSSHSVSAGAVLLDLRGDGCRIGGTSAQNCAYVLSVSPIVSKAAIGILALMSLTTVFLVVMVGRWRLGVYTNPWSMCTLASLSANPDVRRLVLEAGTGADTKQAGTQLKHSRLQARLFPGRERADGIWDRGSRPFQWHEVVVHPRKRKRHSHQ